MISIIVFLGLVTLAASSGAVFKPGIWYESLSKPDWTPAPWVFPLVWTILYGMIAISGWLMWQAQGFGAAIALWGVQLALNMSWSWQFFGRRRMDIGLMIISAMFITILAYIFVSWSQSQLAAMLFVPYGIWVLIAAKLNFEVLRLNHDKSGSS